MVAEVPQVGPQVVEVAIESKGQGRDRGRSTSDAWVIQPA